MFKKIGKFIAALLISFSAAAVGSLATTKGLDPWYKNLEKPPLNPPSWIFAPVWSTLYFLIAISLFIVWNKNVSKDKTDQYIIFVIQLVLNAAWSIVFFGLEDTWYALVVIGLLLLSIIATMVSFAKISRAAMYLLIPYLLWVSFATYLNVSIALLN